METDPYTTLDVSRDATIEEIKKAYRARAHLCHPDRSGEDSEAFIMVNEAYQVLVDPEKRAYYDKHGHQKKKGKPAVDPELATLRDIVIEVIRVLGAKVLTTDLFDHVKATIEAGGKDIRADIRGIKREIDLYTKVRERIKGPGGSRETVIHESIDGIIGRLTHSLEERERAQEVNTLMAKLVKSFSFEMTGKGRRSAKKRSHHDELLDEMFDRERPPTRKGRPSSNRKTDAGS